MSVRTARRGAAAGWTAGLSVFAGLMLLMMGVLQGLQGLAALIHGDFFAADSRYAYHLNITAWGWAHLLLGVVAVGIGVGVLQGVAVARYAAIAVAFVTAIGNFLFIPYYPLWAIPLVALDIAVIWALAGAEPRRP
jgi:hypothetical protein